MTTLGIIVLIVYGIMIIISMIVLFYFVIEMIKGVINDGRN